MLDDIYSPLERAKYDLVHTFPGGAGKLAPLARMNPGTLSNKVNPAVETHHLTIDEGVALQNAAQDYRILRAEAMVLGHACIPLGDYTQTSDVELLSLYAKLHAEIGDVAAAISTALDDRTISRTEFYRIANEGQEMIQAWLALRARLEALIDD